MTRKKQPPKNPRLSVQDLDGTLRTLFAEIAATVSNGEHNVAFGVRYAGNFTAEELKRVTAPLDYTTCSIDDLITLCAHGDTYKTRGDAARELARRSEERKPC